MKKFDYDNTIVMQNEIICYAFHSDLLKANEVELYEFLNTLSKAFPRTISDDGSSKPINNQELLNTWNNAYSNVSRILEMKKVENRHRSVITVSIGTFVVLAVTLLWRIYSPK